MLRSKVTGKGMPLYIVNVLPQKDFENIYKIEEICHISVKIKHFRINKNPKFLSLSEIWIRQHNLQFQATVRYVLG